MAHIIAPLSIKMEGPAVADLQDALRFLLEKAALLAEDQGSRDALLNMLPRERERSQYLEVTSKLVEVFQKEHGLDATGGVDERTAFLLNSILEKLGFDPDPDEEIPEFQYLVRGHVKYRGGLSLPDVIVRAYHRELRSEIALGETKTNEDGNFEIYYNPDSISRAGGVITDRPPDIFVRVSDYSAENGAEQVLAESPTVFAAQRIVKLRVQIEGGPSKTWSDYEQIERELQPYLRDLKISDLVEDKDYQDVSLLAGKMALEPARLATFVAAHRLAGEVGGDPAVFYGLIRRGLPSNLSELLAVPAGARSQALAQAIRSGIAPGRLVGQVRKIRDEFTGYAARYAAADQPKDARARLGTLIRAGGNDRAKMDTIVSRLMTHRGSASTMWEELANDPDIAADVPQAQLTLQLAALTGRHVPLMNSLFARQRDGGMARIADLAALSKDDWLNLIETSDAPEAERVPPSITGQDFKERADVYAATLTRLIADTMPTQVLAHRAQADETVAEPVRTFWRNVTSGTDGFELGRGAVTPYLEKHPELLAGIEDRDTLLRNLGETQRLFSMTPDYDEQKALRATGLTSAASVSRLGQTAFVQRMGDTVTPQKAIMIYEKAARVSAIALDILGTFSPSFNSRTPLAIQPAPTRQIPNLETLFGSFDLCGCDQCRSVHGPAAYYADLLAWLSDRKAVPAPRNARQILFDRRPDLGEIELSCANTNTVLPYTDLVNEILEEHVAPFQFFEIAPEFGAELNARTISDGLRAALAAEGLPLAADARVIVGEPDVRWSLTDGSILYSIQADDHLFVTGVWPQTGAPAETLAAVPEHVNPRAYAKLREAVFPPTLPLDLPTEEVRTFLGHLGVPRHELMTELFAGGPDAALGDVSVAADHLGLSDVERQYVTADPAAPAHEPWDFWGLDETGNDVRIFVAVVDGFDKEPLDWIEAVAQVQEAVRLSGLEYDMLVRMLGTSFVNPGLVVRIVSADPLHPATCDLSKLVMTDLTEDIADRLSRFIRLWRKVGGEPEALDLVLTSLCGGQLDGAALVKLSHVTRLSVALGRTVEEVVALFAPIPTGGDDSLYARLFLNADVSAPVDAAYTLGVGNELAIVAADPGEAKIAKHASAILAALRLSSADLAALQADGIAADDNLTLANLSALFRHALLARGLEIGVPDLLLLRRMAGLDPFRLDATADTLRFVELVVLLRDGGLAADDIGYLLFHLAPDTAPLAPPVGAIADLVSTIRRELLVVREATTPRPDPAGDLLRRELSALRWPAAMVDEAIAAIGGTASYTETLDPAPAGFAVPADFATRLLHDPAGKTLTLTGPLTPAERDALAGAFPEQNYKDAVAALFARPRAAVAGRLRAWQWPIVSAPLAALPAGLAFPPVLRGRISYDPAAQSLRFDGTMSAADRASLAALSADPAWVAAVDALLAAADAFVPAPENQFVTAALADELFAETLPGDRFGKLLALALARRRRDDGARIVVRLIAEATGMKPRLGEDLLTRRMPHPSDPARKAVDAFLEEPFAASDVDVPPTEAVFPAAFNVAIRMTKIAALVSALGLSDRVIGWLGSYGSDVAARATPWGAGAIQAGWLALADLPASTAPVDPARFAAWLRLARLARVGRLLPGGEASADEIFRAARNPAMDADGIAARIAELTGWDAAELKALAAAIGVALPQDLADEAELERLASAVRRLRRLGTTTAQAQSWAAPAPDADAGTAARRAVQAAYGPEQWPDAIRPLEDVLREKRRAALVAYLTVRPDSSNRETWTNTDEMFGHLLIDVETQPVVLTSRLKQAIGSVQLGIQRFFMNLDPYVVTDAAADAGWTQWPWLKQYRVWEANRKIFLYPENWIEPELRDDKSPFFEELETTLLQADLTNDLAETAYASYLARLDEVARLDVVGMFNQPGEGGAPDELHVFGCTRNDPPVHFYRKWVGQARWTPWQRLDLDIPRGSILPLVWNRRLYLFWPIFTLKSKNPPAGGDKPVEGKPFYEIQLAWSEQRQGRWGPKKTVPSDVILESKLSVSMARTPEREHVFRASIDGGDLRIWYEATYSKADQLDNYGNVVSKGGAPVTNGWLFSGCNGSVTIFTPSNVGVYPPPGMSAVGMCYAERIPSTGSFQLPKGMTGTDPEVVLRFTPGNSRFRVLSPHQERTLTGQLPLFFHDDSQIYFIVPRQAMEWTFRWPQAEGINPQIVDIIHQQYYEPNRLIDPLGPIAQIYDPAPVIRQRFEKETAGRSGPSIGAFTIAPVVPVLTTAGLSGVVEGKSVTTRSARVALNTAVTPQAATKIVAVGDHRIVDIQEYLRPERLTDSVYLAGSSAIVRRYEFQSFYHPYACTMMRELNMHGVGGLLVRWVQMMKATPFEGRYGPTAMVEKGDATALDKYPVEDMDFRFDGAYAIYNWELFFHVPLMIACKLSQNQRFEEAQKWFHAIFDPTDASAAPSPAKFWRTRPFFEQEDYLKQRIDALLEALAKGEADENLSRQVSEWVANPFRPFAVARLRTVAFQKMVVMKYIDNLIAWGDQLFRRDTIESINEATQLYILAAQILGPRPPVLTPRAQPEVHNFRTLMPKFEELTNELTSIESIISSPRVDAVLTSPDSPPLPVPQMLYFCVTPNDKLLGYWDTVADRLFKIRNSLNLAGIRRTLPLFEPPIDPALLVKAAAAGVDLSSAIADMAAPGPLYRFPVLAQKAAELCQEVKGLGAALLQALERRDSEELARIQSVHEISLMKEVKKVRDNEIRDAKAQIVALEAAREQTAERYRHSMTLLGKAPVIPPEGTAAADAETVPGAATKIKEGVRMIAQEASQLDEMAKAADAEEAAADWDVASNLSYYIPEFHVDVKPWGIGAGVDFGGRHVGPALTAIANKWRSSAADHRHKSEKASRLASYIMRANDWRLEANLAAREMAKVDKDLAAARIREAIATVNRDNHLKDIEQREQAGEFLRSKYTNRELYDWMIGQISAVYFQAYQLAYDTARRAEQSFRRELAVPDTDYIRFGYWDSLRKGLLAGDRLLHDVHRMELAYLDQNAREYEITKHVSLANLHPEGLMALQEQGSCFLDLPEAIFDLDHAGHYMRRIKAVHVTIPCVTGPYTSIPCKLILLANRTRVDPRPTPQYGATGAEDRRFEFNSGGIRSVVISSGRDDSGSFEFNLRDERYLPFEGAGVISSWRLELPAEFRQFDYRTISDVILHIRYTAREGGDPLKLAATRQLADALKAMEVERGREGLAQGLSARQSFPDAWHAFAYKPDAQPGVQTLSLPIDPRRFPGFASGRVKVDRLLVALIPAAGIGYDNQDGITLTLTPPGGQPVELKLESIPARAGGLPMAEAILPAPVKIAAPKPGQPVAPWTLEIAGLPEGFARTVTVDDAEVKRLDPAKVADVALLLGYTI